MDNFGTKFNQKIRIGIVRNPTSKIGIQQLNDVIEVIKPFSDQLYVVSGNRGNHETFRSSNYSDTVQCKRIDYNNKGNKLYTRLMDFLIIQFKLLISILKAPNMDLWIMVGGNTLFLPPILFKILRKKSVLLTISDIAKAQEQKNLRTINLIYMSCQITYRVYDYIILYSENLVHAWNLENYKNKIYIAHKHHLNFKKFTIYKEFEQRGMIVGYVGSLIKRKNVLELVKAIKSIKKNYPKIKLWIIGDGPEKETIKRYIDENHMGDYVKLLGRIPHEDIPKYLNEMKLFVFPTHHEGLPNAVLEAMACGTPVVASPVDAIPDIIQDGKTGFFLNGKNSETIAQDILKAINHTDLERVAKNAQEFVKENFNFDVAVGQHRKVFEEISKHG